MTNEELEQIQAVCHEWLRQPGTSNGSRMTIPLGDSLSRTIEIEVRSLLTFDNVMITSVVDAETGSCYSKLIALPGEPGEFIDTPLDQITFNSTSPVEEQPSPLRATQKRYKDAMERLAETQQAEAESNAASAL